VVAEDRLAQYPGVPTVKEQGIDLAVRKFRGLAGPKGIDAETVASLDAAVPKLLADPVYKAVYAKNGLLPGFIPSTEYAAFIREFGRETEAFLQESGVIR
jgi:tripartite-type tricarboxylate transporter receptor subunit TctC